MLVRKLLFVILSIIFLFIYFLIIGYSHLELKQTVQDFTQTIFTRLSIKKQLYQSKEILKFLPSTIFLGYLIDPAEQKEFELVEFFSPVAEDLNWPSFQEVLIFYQKGSSQPEVVFKLNNPIQENWQKYQIAIKNIWAQKYPSQKSKTLPDGTVVLELVPEPEEVKIEKIDYQGKEIMILVENQFSLAYTLINEYAILTTYSPISASRPDIYLILEAQANENQRADIGTYFLCVAQEPYKLIIKDQDFLNNWVEKFGLADIFNIDKPKKEKCG